MWKTRVTVDNNRMPKPFLDIAVESDRKTKLHVLFNFEEDNKWELKIDRVPGQKMTIEATINGQKWTGVGTLNQAEMKLNLKMDSEFTGKHFNVDFDLNPAGMWGLHVTGDVEGPVDAKWTMQQDFTMGEVAIKYKNQNYAFMQLKGNAEKRGMFPVMFDYVVKYSIIDVVLDHIVEHDREHAPLLSVALQLHESVVLVLVLDGNFSHGEVLLHGPLGIHRSLNISGDMETPHACGVQIKVHVEVLASELGVHLQVQLHFSLV